MGRLRFVQPKSVRLPLSDGDFIDIKHELTAGEEREVFARMTKRLEPGKPAQLLPEQVELAQIVAYLVGWSFLDAHGQPVEISEDAVKGLDSDTFKEVYTAIDTHEKAVVAAKAEEKKVTPSGGPALSAI